MKKMHLLSNYYFTAISIIILGALGSCKKDKLEPNKNSDSQNYITSNERKSQRQLVPLTSTVTDVDGNVYQTKRIGNKRWMTENLKVTHYRNGDPILAVIGINLNNWTPLLQGAYTDNINCPTFGAVYGHLYNFYAVDDSRKIAPVGWHVATYQEWLDLYSFLGGGNAAVLAMCEAGNSHWGNGGSAITQCTNSSGLTVLPAGMAYPGPPCVMYGNLNYSADFWTSSVVPSSHEPYSLQFMPGAGGIGFFWTNDRNFGFGVRCVKD